MGRRSRPIIDPRYSYYCGAINLRWDKHIFVARQNRLTDCVYFSAIILDCYGADSIVTIRLVWKGFADLSIRIAIKTTVLSLLAHGFSQCQLEQT